MLLKKISRYRTFCEATEGNKETFGNHKAKSDLEKLTFLSADKMMLKNKKIFQN